MLIRDALGSTVAVAAAGGYGRIEYDDFGWPQTIDHEHAPEHMPELAPLFAGMFWLVPTGLYDARARIYDPTTGRFTTPDPIGPWGDEKNFGNAYVYAGNNPGSAIDVMGTYWTPVFEDCTASERADLRQSVKYAEEYAQMGQRQVNWVSGGKSQSARRKRWYDADPLRLFFGTFESSTRFKVVRNNVRDIFRRCRATKIKFKCRTKAGSCSGNSTSWTLSTWTSSIRVCRTEGSDLNENSFWQISYSIPRLRSFDYTDEGKYIAESKATRYQLNNPDMAAVIIHESAHNVGPIGDHSYGFTATTSFANRKPLSAGYNAESYEEFIHACARRFDGGKKKCK
ncbi:MAG: hypothetical protein HC927_03145 [Deltaproteobacteria bacterium]|nr:hypothetical protein [Deltaproteobacteria bacterium]